MFLQRLWPRLICSVKPWAQLVRPTNVRAANTNTVSTRSLLFASAAAKEERQARASEGKGEGDKGPAQHEQITCHLVTVYAFDIS
eukprot:4852639-Amphidinium_carterae.1